MPLVNLVSLRNELIIPIRSSCLVSTNEQSGSTSWIKSIKYTVRATFVLASEFAHIVESRAVNRVGVRALQVNPKFFQRAHRKSTLSCSSASRLFHQTSNSLVNSTSYAIAVLFHKGIITSR